MKMHLYWSFEEWEDKPTPTLYAANYMDCFKDRVYGGEIEVNVGTPPTREDFIAPKIAGIKKDIDDHMAAIDKLRERMQQLTAIEFKP